MSNDRRTKAQKQAATTQTTSEPPKRQELGPYLVPLFLNGQAIRELEPSERDIAALRYQHWISMMRRNPRGFRQDSNKRPNPLAMFLNGLKLVARHGNDAPGSAFS